MANYECLTFLESPAGPRVGEFRNSWMNRGKAGKRPSDGDYLFGWGDSIPKKGRAPAGARPLSMDEKKSPALRHPILNLAFSRSVGLFFLVPAHRDLVEFS